MGSPRLLIIAGDTDGNLGDLAIVSATIQVVRELSDAAVISLVTGRPERDRARLGIEPIPRGIVGLRSLLRAARRADLVICGGGGLFQDDDSLIKMPYWALRLWLVKRTTARIAGLSIGAGPLRHPASRWFARLALRQLDPITVRDHTARLTLAPLTSRRVDLVPDPAFMLIGATPELAQKSLAEHGVPVDGTPLIGVSVKRSFHANSNLVPHKYAVKYHLRKIPGAQKMRRNVRLTAAALDTLVATRGAHIVFMPTYRAPHENDIDICRDVAERMQSPNHSLLALDDPTIYKAVCAELDVMIAGRMHAAILAAGANTPVVGLAYNPKFAGMFELLDRSDRCIELEEFIRTGEYRMLSDRVSAVMGEGGGDGATSQRLAARTREYLRTLLDGRVA